MGEKPYGRNPELEKVLKKGEDGIPVISINLGEESGNKDNEGSNESVDEVVAGSKEELGKNLEEAEPEIPLHQYDWTPDPEDSLSPKDPLPEIGVINMKEEKKNGLRFENGELIYNGIPVKLLKEIREIFNWESPGNLVIQKKEEEISKSSVKEVENFQFEGQDFIKIVYSDDRVALYKKLSFNEDRELVLQEVSAQPNRDQNWHRKIDVKNYIFWEGKLLLEVEFSDENFYKKIEKLVGDEFKSKKVFLVVDSVDEDFLKVKTYVFEHKKFYIFYSFKDTGKLGDFAYFIDMGGDMFKWLVGQDGQIIDKEGLDEFVKTHKKNLKIALSFWSEKKLTLSDKQEVVLYYFWDHIYVKQGESIKRVKSDKKIKFKIDNILGYSGKGIRIIGSYIDQAGIERQFEGIIFLGPNPKLKIEGNVNSVKQEKNVYTKLIENDVSKRNEIPLDKEHNLFNKLKRLFRL